MLVDLFVKWRIIDVQQYYISVSGDENRAHERGCCRRSTTACAPSSANATVHEVVSGERDEIMELMRAEGRTRTRAKSACRCSTCALKRVDLPQEVSESVYGRMEAERKRVANELRSDGRRGVGKDSRRRRPAARGHPRQGLSRRAAHQGRGRRARHRRFTRGAYEQNPEFYAFYRSLEAYTQSFKNKSDVLVLEPSSEFFKYLKNSKPSK